MKINCVSIIVQCFLCTVNKISARKHLIVHAILFPTVSRWRCFNFYSTDHLQNKVANGGNGPEQFPIQAHLFYRVLRGQIENFAAYEFLSILWVKCCLGNLEKARQAAVGRVGWGRLLRGSWTTVYCKWRVLNEKTIQEEKKKARRSTRFVAWMICFACLHPLKADSPHYPWRTQEIGKRQLAMYKVMRFKRQSYFISCHNVAFFAFHSTPLLLFLVSFCLIRKLTMFSLVKRKKKQHAAKQQNRHWAVMFFSFIQFEASPTGTLYCNVFHVALALKLQWKHHVIYMAYK